MGTHPTSSLSVEADAFCRNTSMPRSTKGTTLRFLPPPFLRQQTRGPLRLCLTTVTLCIQQQQQHLSIFRSHAHDDFRPQQLCRAPSTSASIMGPDLVGQLRCFGCFLQKRNELSCHCVQAHCVKLQQGERDKRGERADGGRMAAHTTRAAGQEAEGKGLRSSAGPRVRACERRSLGVRAPSFPSPPALVQQPT